jgi:hypothetical protein
VAESASDDLLEEVANSMMHLVHPAACRDVLVMVMRKHQR